MIPTVAIIPTRDRIDLLRPLVRTLLDDPGLTNLVIFDNTDDGSVRPELEEHPKLSVLGAPGWPIYRMWNQGWRIALDVHDDDINLAFLNDDIVVPDLFLSMLGDALRSDPKWWAVYPDYNRRVEQGVERAGITATKGTYKDGGMCGWAFMVRGEKADTEVYYDPLPFIDEQFEWWCGDDDMARNIELHGGSIGRVDGVPVDHVGEASAHLHVELHAAKGRDVERWRRKAGGF